MGAFMLARPRGCHDRHMARDKEPGRRRGLALRLGAAAAVAEAIVVWARAGRPGGNIVVRCRRGHLYTTLWIPAVSVKALRLGPWRVQWCPVGRHVALVTPVRESDLPPQQRHAARAHRDIRIP
jgi:hypothetical protein